MSDLELRNYFEFDESDLAANRAGRLTEEQEARARLGDGFIKPFFFWGGMFLLLIAGFATYKMITDATGGDWKLISRSDFVTNAPGLIMLWGALGFLAFKAFHIAGKSKPEYSVQKTQGKINFVKVEARVTRTSSSGQKYRTEEQYELRVGRTAFEDVDEELLNIIEEGDIYAFYHVKDTQDILSCEFISKGK